MTLKTKYLAAAIGPSSYISANRSSYRTTKIDEMGMFAVGSRLPVSGRNITLKWDMAFSDGTNGAVDVVRKLYEDTLGGCLLFGMVPPPCYASYPPRVLGNSQSGEFYGDFEYSNVGDMWTIEEVGTGQGTPSGTGLQLRTGGGSRPGNYVGILLNQALQPNIVYRFDYTMVGTADLRLGIAGSWFEALPSSGSMSDFTYAAPTATDDGKMFLDLAPGDHSIYFSIPEDTVASTSVNPAFSANRFVIRTVGGTIPSGYETAEISRIGLFRVGSLFRFASLTIDKETGAKYSIKAELEESVTGNLSSPWSNPV